MIKASSLHPKGTRPHQGAHSAKRNAVKSKPFVAPRDPVHEPTGTCSASTSGSTFHQLSSNHHYGIQTSPPQKQLLINLQDYRRGVGICIVNRQGLVFSARRMDDTEGTWQMPQGGIDPQESPEDAALRELKEETGIENARVVASMDDWLHYDFPTKVRAQMDGPWLRYRGQTQRWFLVQYLGDDDSEIDLTCHGEPEFSEYSWMQLDHLPERVVSFKQHVYREVVRHFSPRIRQLVAEQHSWHQGIC